MLITPGTRIGAYEVAAAIGAGGMGEVYRARDTRLNRDVALKILPAAFASDPERLARFEREAQLLASLNHPNIAQIYGIEEGPADGGHDVRALVMELVDGETLADRIARGPIPIEDALPIARQIAEALEAAHERGIIHRDLKPANIKLRDDGTVKVLDFGLAKLAQPTGTGNEGRATASMSPTITSPALMTGVGTLLGTAAYMSPEQAKGREADRRSDIWAFGCVLYEMVTAHRAFPGDDIAETLAAVIKTDPDLAAVPRRLRRALRVCLTRNPRERLAAIGDVWLLVDRDEDAVSARPRRRLWRLAAGLVALLAALGALGAWSRFRSTRRDTQPLTRLDVRLDRKALVSLASPPALSPDGRRIVFSVTNDSGQEQLATRVLDQSAVTLLPDTVGASAPFFSPDSEWVGFFAEGKLKKISVRGGPPVTLCEALTARGASWGDDGTIVAGLRNTSGLYRVPEGGGTAMPFTQLAAGEATHRWPQVLPGGDAVLLTASPSVVAYEDASIRVVSRSAGIAKTIVQNGYFGRYLPVDARHGYLLYIRDGTLFGAAFDPVRLEVRGNPVPVLDDVATSTSAGIGTFDLSTTGTFLYVSGSGADRRWPVVWLARDGRATTLIGNEAAYDSPRIAPDGKRLAVQVSTGRTRDLYVYDIQRDTLSRLTFAGGGSPVWAPDGRHIAYSTNATTSREGGGIFWVRSDGSSNEPVKLLQSERVNRSSYSFSPDGRYLAYFETNAETANDIGVASLDMSDPDRPKLLQTESFLKTAFSELEPNFSPDGRWILYRSNETGVMEAYVRPFRGSGKWQISSGGVMHPRWSPAGRQLFYETLDGHVMVADYDVQGESFVATRPRLWTATAIRVPSGGFNMDIAPTGDRLVAFPRPTDAQQELGGGHATILLNFVDELRRRIPIE